MEDLRPKEPWLAVLLSLLLPGLGHIYSNKAKRGVVLFFSYLAFGIILLTCLFNLHTPVGIMLIIPAIIVPAFGLYILIDSYRCAAAFNARNNLAAGPAGGKRVLIILGVVFLVFVFNPVPFLAAYYIRGNLVQSFRLPTGSMRPTLLEGDSILIDKGIYKRSDPARGDVVVFISPQDKRKTFIKRIVGLPGETVEIKDNKVLINAVPVTLPVIAGFRYINTGAFAGPGKAVTVPEDSYYVLGDNTLSSFDSRNYGFIPRKNLLGKAFRIYWPFPRSGPIK